MRSRSLIHIAGPHGAGKTAFVEAWLRAEKALTLCVRGQPDDTLASPRESAPKQQAELRRYRAAGASGSALYRFPPSEAAWDAFFTSTCMQDYSEAVMIEGDSPLDQHDLEVFVAPPLPDGERLLHRIAGASVAAAKTRPPDLLLGLPDFLREHLLSHQLAHAALEAVLKAQQTKQSARKARLADAELPASLFAGTGLARGKCWSVHSAYSGIEHAQLVVINLRDHDQRAAAERLAEGITRIRKDDAIRLDILGWRGKKVPVTVAITDLTDAKHPDLRKALARLTRAVRSARA